MFAKVSGSVSRTLGLVAALAVATTPAIAADDLRTPITGETRAAFAGATFRLALGGTGRQAPQARLGIGMIRYGRDGAGPLVSRDGAALPLAAGLDGGRLSFRAGGAALGPGQNRMGLSRTTTIVLVVGGLVAAGAVTALVLLDNDTNAVPLNPCPPGVEVCIAPN